MFLAAALHTSVGHAGASAYIALMALFGVSPAVMRPTALALTILVAGLTSLRCLRVEMFRWRTLRPFLVGAIILPADRRHRSCGRATSAPPIGPGAVHRRAQANRRLLTPPAAASSAQAVPAAPARKPSRREPAAGSFPRSLGNSRAAAGNRVSVPTRRAGTDSRNRPRYSSCSGGGSISGSFSLTMCDRPSASVIAKLIRPKSPSSTARLRGL